MLHRNLREMLDEMLNDPDELLITSNSKHFALITLRDGTTLFLEGDFSGTTQECEAEVRRILTYSHPYNSRRRHDNELPHR
ncbi:MAG TPA: hypothetical protein VM715_22315 [Candidatus Acidoferrum sp.]|nr:hypothetical protein [Candidatus Acidoferrum sp.]